MSYQQLPGSTGYFMKQVSSSTMSKDQLGKFMDSNHFDRLLEGRDSQEYDRVITSLFSEGGKIKNTFFEDIVNNASTFYVENPRLPFYWDIDTPPEMPKIVGIPSSTSGLAKIGVDGQTFQFVSSHKHLVLNDHVKLGDYDKGPELEIVADPLPYDGNSWLYTAVLSSLDKTSFLNSTWFHIGVPLLKMDNAIGEFDQDLSSVFVGGGKIRLFDTLGAGFGVEHTATTWAMTSMPKSADGRPLDLTVITRYEMNERGEKVAVGANWMRTIEVMMNKEMMAMGTRRALYGSAGTTQTSGQQQEVKYKSAGLIPKIRMFGNYFEIPKGTFSINLLRIIYDDFYRGRVAERKETIIYANTEGIRRFRDASKEDLLASGFTLVLDDRFATGKGQNIILNWGVGGVVTEETGLIKMIHLPELDFVASTGMYGKTKNRAPKYLALDVLDNSKESIKNNIRKIRPKGQPDKTWGWIDGRFSNKGFSASQGMNSASKFPGTTAWIEDRWDLRIDDLSRTLLIEEEEEFLY